MSLRGAVERWSADAPESVDLTQPEQGAWVRSIAEELLSRAASADELVRLEESSLDAPILLRLAMKLAQSRMRVLALTDDFRVSVVFAVYKEHNRLRTQAEHPHGEDFLVRKVEQVEWLFAGQPRARWDMLVVDDGCPDRSGEIAREIIEARGFGDRVRVLFLRDAIEANHPLANGLASTDESQKGGSIQYGMGVAAEAARPGHVVVFTDADLSTHLGQIGLLLDPILVAGFDAAIGSRREPLSVVIKGGARNARGKLFIYLWKRLIPHLSPIVDTQCGFKAFRADVAKAVVADTVEKGFSFDIELLLQTVLARPRSIRRVPIAWIDSEAASTTAILRPYLAMIQSIVRIARHYLPSDPASADFAELIESLDRESWARLASQVPSAIAERDPSEFDAFNRVSAEDLRLIAHSDE